MDYILDLGFLMHCWVTSVVSDSVRPHRRQPTRLPHPWDSPGKNSGVGCHFLLQCMKVKNESEVTQLCLTLRDPVDRTLPGSSIHGIFQARVLEWGANAFSISCTTMFNSSTNAGGYVPLSYLLNRWEKWDIEIFFRVSKQWSLNLKPKDVKPKSDWIIFITYYYQEKVLYSKCLLCSE